MDRSHWTRRIAQLDAVDDAHEIYRILFAYEFPWDLNQALSFALYRTYAVPSIGRLLARTGEFTRRTQKRWLDRWGWRRLTEHERVATANYYRALGRHMNIKNIPATHAEFSTLLDRYEREHFGYDGGGRAVADATLNLMTTFPPHSYAPKPAVRRFARALMDDPLLDAFGYRHPTHIERALASGGLKARAAIVRRLPARSGPKYFRQMSSMRSYPSGYAVGELGTFPSTTTPTAGA